MAVIATDKTRLSHVLKAELYPELAYCRTVVTVNDTAQTLELGTVLGKVTANGKYKVAVETAVDGSKVGAGIVIDAKTIANGVDTPVLVLTRGPATVSKAGLVIAASYDNGTKLGVLYADLEAKGIQVLESA